MTLPAHRFAARTQKTSEEGARNFAFDIDGTIDAFPRPMAALITALTAAGHRVYILTGVAGDHVADSDIEGKRAYLASLGVGSETYTELVVCPEPHAENKQKAMKALKVGVLVDNNKSNVKQAAKAGVVSLLVWNSKEK